MLQQLQLFQQAGLGSFRDLMVAVAQDPAMLVFLDAGVNTKNAPNENFAREIMELVPYRETGDLQVRFVHDKLLEGTLESLSPVQARRLHRSAASALASRDRAGRSVR